MVRPGRPRTKEVEAMDVFMRQFYQWYYCDDYSLRDVTVLFRWLIKLLIVIGRLHTEQHVTLGQWRKRDREWKKRWHIRKTNLTPIPERGDLANHELWFIEDQPQTPALRSAMINVKRPDPFPIPVKKRFQTGSGVPTAASNMAKSNRKKLDNGQLVTNESYTACNIHPAHSKSPKTEPANAMQSFVMYKDQNSTAMCPFRCEDASAWAPTVETPDAAPYINHRYDLNYSNPSTMVSSLAGHAEYQGDNCICHRLSQFDEVDPSPSLFRGFSQERYLVPDVSSHLGNPYIGPFTEPFGLQNVLPINAFEASGFNGPGYHDQGSIPAYPSILDWRSDNVETPISFGYGAHSLPILPLCPAVSIASTRVLGTEETQTPSQTYPPHANQTIVKVLRS